MSTGDTTRILGWVYPVWVLFSKDTSTLTGVYRWYYTDTRMSVLCWVLFFKDTPTLTGVYKGCYTYIGMTDENYAHKNGTFANWNIFMLNISLSNSHIVLSLLRALRLLALRESLSTLYLYSGLQPSLRGKITSNNVNLRNLHYIKNICHLILASITSESAHPITPVEPLKPRFWDNSGICLLFTRKQQQIFTTCCWQYYIWNQRTRLRQ